MTDRPAIDLPDLPQALCTQVGDPDLFFPKPGDNGHAARNICTGTDRRPACPELQACLAYALANDVEGIWAGTGGEERRRWRRAEGIRAPRLVSVPREMPPRAPIAHGTPRGYAAHIRHRVDVCDPCRDAYRAYRAEGKRRRRGAAA